MRAMDATPDAEPARTSIVVRHSLIAFFALALAFSWLAASPALVLGLPFGPYQTLGAFGPLLAALIVSAASGGREAITALLRRMTAWRFGLGTYALVFFGLLVMYLAAVLLSGALSLTTLLAKWGVIITFYIPALFTTYLVNPIGEETGWTGFALPQLQKRFSPWLGAVLLGLLWALWHLPAYFVPSELGAFSLVGFGIFALLAVCTRVIWTWITNKARGSGLAAVLLHASSNAVSVGLFAVLLPPLPPGRTDDLSGPILLGLMLLSAFLILVITRGRLSHEEGNYGTTASQN